MLHSWLKCVSRAQDRTPLANPGGRAVETAHNSRSGDPRTIRFRQRRNSVTNLARDCSQSRQRLGVGRRSQSRQRLELVVVALSRCPPASNRVRLTRCPRIVKSRLVESYVRCETSRGSQRAFPRRGLPFHRIPRDQRFTATNSVQNSCLRICVRNETTRGTPRGDSSLRIPNKGCRKNAVLARS